MLNKSYRWTVLRRFFTTALILPALMVAVAPPARAQASTTARDAVSAPHNKRCHKVPESGLLATMGLALGVIASAAVYRRRRA